VSIAAAKIENFLIEQVLLNFFLGSMKIGEYFFLQQG